MVVVALGLGFIIYDVVFSPQWYNKKPVASPETETTYAPNIDVFRTKYFQFQAPQMWSEISNETKENHYVYRSYNQHLVTQELVIEVNSFTEQPLALVQTSRVQAVRVNGNRLQAVGETSAHCINSVAKGQKKSQQIITINQVTFACNPDSGSYEVVVGVVDGTDEIKINRPNNEIATYKITYKNLTVNPNPQDLHTIINSFETR